MISERKTEYKLDRDIPGSVWNRYTKKYGNKYRISRDEIGEWGIRCKFGRIMIYSMLKKQLCFYGDFRSVRHKNAFIKKINGNDAFTGKITQEGDVEIVIMFPEEEIDSLAPSLLPRRKIIYSDEYRRVLIERLEKVRPTKSKED